jgi:hypothetical protein
MAINWINRILGQPAPTASHEHQSPTEVDLLKAAERDAIVECHLNRLLSPLGLTENSARSWIDGSAPPARRMFQISLLKGASMKACWGFSLDFVPHISGWNLPSTSRRKICRHRTDKSAMLDVIVDPRDLTQYCSLFGAAQLNSELGQHLPTAVERARETWRRGETWRGMLEIVQELREKPINCFGFHNYTQLPLAFAFLNAKLGDMAAAESELETYVQGCKLGDEVAAELIKLAHEVGGGPRQN